MHTTLRIIVLFAFALCSCSTTSSEEDAPVKAKVPVEVTGLTRGIVKDELTLFANTLYLKRNVVTSPIRPSLRRSSSNSETCPAGQILYLLETKERRALGSQAVVPDSSALLSERLPSKLQLGIISTLDKQQIGDYVLEGGQLCTIAESNALAFAVNVPFEFTPFAKAGMKCTLVLRTTPGIRQRLPRAHHDELLAQTQTILAKASESLFFPENLIVKVIVNKSAETKQQVLPKACVLTDEMMEKFWVIN